MRALVIVVSIHHQNTLKVAQAIAEELQAKILSPQNFDTQTIEDFDHLSLGSGIYFWSMHPDLLRLVDSLLPAQGKTASIFSTAGVPSLRWHRKLREKLCQKGLQVIGEFTSPGWDSNGWLKIIGGIHRHRPNKRDLARAKDFAKKLSFF